MFGKKEIYNGKSKDKYYEIIDTLEQAHIKVYTKIEDFQHRADMSRGAGIGCYGENRNIDCTYIVMVKNTQYDLALGTLKKAKF